MEAEILRGQLRVNMLEIIQGILRERSWMDTLEVYQKTKSVLVKKLEEALEEAHKALPPEDQARTKFIALPGSRGVDSFSYDDAEKVLASMVQKNKIRQRTNSCGDHEYALI